MMKKEDRNIMNFNFQHTETDSIVTIGIAFSEQKGAVSSKLRILSAALGVVIVNGRNISLGTFREAVGTIGQGALMVGGYIMSHGTIQTLD